MTTRLQKPVRRRVGDVVVELTGDGIVFRRAGCKRRVFVSYAEAIELAIETEGYRFLDGLAPAEHLARLRKRRQGQPRTLFSRTRKG